MYQTGSGHDGCEDRPENEHAGSGGGGEHYNPFDEYAVEEALLIREKHGGEVT